jgi:hypothetical protein
MGYQSCGAGSREDEIEALIVIEGIVIALLVILVAGLLRSHAEILRKLDSLGAGEVHESFVRPPRRIEGVVNSRALSGVSPSGAATTVALAGARGHTLIAFLSSTCTSCAPFWRGAGEFRVDGVRPVVVTKGAEAESPAEIKRLAGPMLTTIMSTEAWEEFRVPATPYFALVDGRDGRLIGEGSSADWSRVADMVRRALGDAGLHRNTAQRKADIDSELAEAGIEPGDPRLFQRPPST